MSIDSVMPLKIYVLGAPEITCDEPVTAQQLPTKARALLFYLAMTGRAHTRAALASLLWSEHGEEEARRNLRKVIQALREHLDPYLAIDHQTVAFRSSAAYWVDAVEFAAAVPAPALGAKSAGLDGLQASLALYRADFLEGFYVRDAPIFESWMLAERTRLRELMLQRLVVIGERHAAAGNLPHAIATFRRLLELEPWREEAHRQLMLWLAQSGQRNAALVQYDLCCRALADELGVEPDEATRSLHASLLQPIASALRQTPQPPPAAVVDYPLVGRKSEYQALRSTWAKAVQSGAQMVFVAGEAGIGKTRLAEELLLHVQRQGHVAVRARAYALEGRVAYAPIADWLRTPPLQAKLAELNPIWLTEVARLLPELRIEHPDLPAPEPLAERWQQKRLFEALRYAYTAGSRPLLLLLDDLQWCDAETLAWLQYLVETAPQAPLLVVGTLRSDEVDEEHHLHQLRRALLRGGRLSTIELAPLSPEDTTALGAEVREYVLEAGAAASLYRATAGNPLFIVETVRAGDMFATPGKDVGHHTASPSASQPDAGLPPKVYAAIESRLAQLSPAACTLAQVAATIGRAFTLPLLAEASRKDEETVVAGLDELWRRRIVREQSGSRYDFTHDRIRDVAYAASSPVKRVHFHQRVAQALEKLHAADLDPIAGELATHYQHAGNYEKAFGHYCRAATVASQLYAHKEEAGFLHKAIAAAEELLADAATTGVVIDLWNELGLTQVKIHDWSSEHAAVAWRRAAELAEQAGLLRQRSVSVRWLAIVAQNRGDWHKARELDQLAISLARQSGDAPWSDRLSADYGITLYHFGEFAAALAAFRRNPVFAAEPAALAEIWARDDLSSSCYLRFAKSLWLLGYPDQALAYAGEMAARRHLLAELPTRCVALTFVSIFYSYLRDALFVQKLSDDLIAVSLQCDFPLFITEGRLLRGWALAQQGAVAEGLTLLRESVADERRRGIRMFEPFNRSLLAEALSLAEEWEEALDEVTGALADAEVCGNSFWNAHLHKLQGDYMLALSLPADDAEACYQRAIATARRQGAKSLELRATTSLCHFWQQQGKQAQAQELLSAIYGWFTEGFDTVDLREAQVLLAEL